MSRTNPASPSPQSAGRQPRSSRGTWFDWRTAVAVVWLVGFFLFFYSFGLPNNPEPENSRPELWKDLPFLLIEIVDPSSAADQLASGWVYFPQRYDLIAIAAIILAGAWGLGHLLLRVLRPPLPARCVERTVFAFAVGLSGLSLLTLGCGLAGQLSRTLLGTLLLSFLAVELGIRTLWEPNGDPQSLTKAALKQANPWFTWDRALVVTCIVVIVPFLMAILLGALLPSIDFDAKEYHLQGPKEFFQQGRITFLPHNVYTSFPFLTEMLSLLAMVLADDWFEGALAGKGVLASFAPLTALALYAAGRRWFTPAVGWLAATVHLTTPWIYRISITAGAEGGLSFYLFAATFATMIAIETLSAEKTSYRQVVLAGLLAGSAMACKYTGIVQVVIPLGLALCVAPILLKLPGSNRRQTALRVVSLFVLGVALTVGPWLVKNSVETGNPTYPLLYTVFGGEDWDADLNAKWRPAHAPPHHLLSDFGAKLIDVIARSDWLSPLLFGLAPLALFAAGPKRMVRWLWLYVLFLFLAWWILTHRIDRFWVPLIPLVSLLAGVGAASRSNVVWKFGCGLVMAAAIVFNLGYVTTALCGFNAYLADLEQARQEAESMTGGIEFLNKRLGPDAKVLCIGEAQVFDTRFPVVYNTVFDRSIFQQWCATEQPDVPAAELPLRDPANIRKKFSDEGITHLFVNWIEILRYRIPGSYGYTDFVRPEVFEKLQEAGVLGQPLTVGTIERSGSSPEENIGESAAWQPRLKTMDDGRKVLVPSIQQALSESNQRELDRWAPSLMATDKGERVLIRFQIFPVKR